MSSSIWFTGLLKIAKISIVQNRFQQLDCPNTSSSFFNSVISYSINFFEYLAEPGCRKNNRLTNSDS